MTDLIPALRTPTAPEGTGRVKGGMAVSRIDGRAKVTGAARYAAEEQAPGLQYGVVVSGTIPRGKVTAIHIAKAEAVAGVTAVLTHLNRPKLRAWDLAYKDMTAPGGSLVAALVLVGLTPFIVLDPASRLATVLLAVHAGNWLMSVPVPDEGRDWLLALLAAVLLSTIHLAAALAAAVLFLVGCAVDGAVLAYWLYHDRGTLTPFFTRLTLFGLLLIAMSVQIGLSALMLGATFTGRGEHRRHSDVAPDVEREAAAPRA